jgi:hypothetical protein
MAKSKDDLEHHKSFISQFKGYAITQSFILAERFQEIYTYQQ